MTRAYDRSRLGLVGHSAFTARPGLVHRGAFNSGATLSP